MLYPVFVAFYRSALVKIPKFFIRFSFRPANVFAIWITSKLSVNFLWQLSTVKLLNRCCFVFDLSHVFRRRAAEKDLSQQALVAGLTANSLHSITTSPIRLRSSLGSFLTSQRTSSKHSIAPLSTQNNYSPSFGFKKLVIFFISSDKTDKKLCRSWKYKTRCRTKRRGGQGMAFDQGASRLQGTITAKSTGAPQNAWHLKLKKIQRI